MNKITYHLIASRSFPEFMDKKNLSQINGDCAICKEKYPYMFIRSDKEWNKIVPKFLQEDFICWKCYTNLVRLYNKKHFIPIRLFKKGKSKNVKILYNLLISKIYNKLWIRVHAHPVFNDFLLFLKEESLPFPSYSIVKKENSLRKLAWMGNIIDYIVYHKKYSIEEKLKDAYEGKVLMPFIATDKTNYMNTQEEVKKLLKKNINDQTALELHDRITNDIEYYSKKWDTAFYHESWDS